jgi:hypothetical protein
MLEDPQISNYKNILVIFLAALIFSRKFPQKNWNLSISTNHHVQTILEIEIGVGEEILTLSAIL